MRWKIGEFSLVARMSVKTLRLYHEKGLLVPAHVDESSGYRFYDEGNLERARIIAWLRGLGFPLAEIAALLDEADRDRSGVTARIRKRLEEVREEIDDRRHTARMLEQMLEPEEEVVVSGSTFEIAEITLEPVLVAGHRMRGRYQDIGVGLTKLCKRAGFHMAGKPMTLFYDSEYKEDDAEFEPAVPVRKRIEADGVECHELPGGRALTLTHQGPYETLHESYGRIFAYAEEKGLTIRRPTREIYRKGPGLLFKGNPEKYVTEIQAPLEG